MDNNSGLLGYINSVTYVHCFEPDKLEHGFNLLTARGCKIVKLKMLSVHKIEDKIKNMNCLL